MADEIPLAPSETTDDVTKSETIRITLPPKSEQPAIKRETVRINVPGKPSPEGVAPKKETTKLPTTASVAGPAPSAGAKTFMPPPPAPKAPPSVPGVPPSVKPLSGANPPPKPPTLGARPTVPLKPAPSTSTITPPEAVTQKATPKKETARITLPPEGGKPSLPKATVKMQQTQPLVNRPQSGFTPAAIQTMAPMSSDAGSDTAVNGMAIAALIISLASLATVYLAYNSAGL